MNFNRYTNKSQEILQQASLTAKNLRHQVVETSHILKALLVHEQHILSFILKNANLTTEQLAGPLEKILEKNSQSDRNHENYLSNDAAKALQTAEGYLSHFGDDYVAIEHILLGICKGNDSTANLLKRLGITEIVLIENIKKLRKGETVKDANAENKYQALLRFAKNLNELSKKGKIDPVIGRDDEIRRVLQILSRRTKNNPILIGEPGVGKTAIVEGLAQRIVKGDIPESLKTKTIMSLDMGLLVAGAKYKGEFEERLKSVIKEVSKSNGEIILFIDEIHTLAGAGGGEGAMDAANLLKPALARGELHTIGATTLNEYQKHIEKDSALERRFQMVMIHEPSTTDTVSILRGIKDKYELHHGVQIKDDAIITAVELSNRYITDRQLPDKAIDLIDEAASKIRIEMDSMPEEMDELNRRILQLEIEREAIRREKNTEKEKLLSKEIAKLNEIRFDIKAKWENEKKQIEHIRGLKKTIDDLKFEAENAEKIGDYGRVAEIKYGKLVRAEKELEENQKQFSNNTDSLLKEEVSVDEIAEVVAKWTGIPTKKMLQKEKDKLINLENELSLKVAGQSEAIQAVADAVRRNKAGLQDPKKPIGSFLFLGTTGVGKTELAKTLASYLFNNENSMIRIDMSEYQERHAVSRLVGAPPGYVGYEEGGQLTEAVRRNPYSVILLDEIEKAHADVFNILLQVLDDGRLTDNKGRIANFKNTIIIMTSNIGAEFIQKELQIGQQMNITSTKENVLNILKENVRPEFLNRIDEIIMFQPLLEEDILKIAKIQFEQIKKRLEKNQLYLTIDDKTLKYLGNKGFDIQYGARPLKRVLQREILNPLSKKILAGDFKNNDRISITLKNDDISFFSDK